MTLARKIRVLLVEDRIEDAEMLLREMRMGGLSIVSQRVDTGAEFETALETFAPDLILSDYSLPGFDGTEALRLAQKLRTRQGPGLLARRVGPKMNETRERPAIGPATQRCSEACATPTAESTNNRIQFDYTVKLSCRLSARRRRDDLVLRPGP